MPERLPTHLRAALERCEQPAHQWPSDHELLVQLVAMHLATTRRDRSGELVWRLTSSGEQALERGWY